MVDVGMPQPVAFDDPGFDRFLDELTAYVNEHPPEPVEEDLSDLMSLPVEFLGAGFLSGVELASLSGRNRVSLLQARIRSQSHTQALIYEDLAAIHDACADITDPELAWEAASSEIRAALRLTRRAADHHLDIALALRDRLPAVLAALKAGDIDQRRAVVIVTGTSHLTDDTARAVAAKILPWASRLTTGQLRERRRRMAIEADPESAATRYEQAVDQRRIELEATDDGTADLMILDAPADLAAAARRHINQIAKSLRKPDEPRTIDQLRADVALDLLCGRHPSYQPSTTKREGSVNLTVDLTTLTGLADHPGDLAGYGPVIADLARQITLRQHDTTWRYTITHPDSAQPIATGITRRRPTAGQHRTITATHPTCVFPGCRMPAIDCDLDHRTAWTDHGPTTEDNLAPLCRHDHRLKHEHGWTLARLPDGDHQWTSPLGHTHTTSGRSP
jgi:hypothetical protein